MGKVTVIFLKYYNPWLYITGFTCYKEGISFESVRYPGEYVVPAGSYARLTKRRIDSSSEFEYGAHYLFYINDMCIQAKLKKFIHNSVPRISINKLLTHIEHISLL